MTEDSMFAAANKAVEATVEYQAAISNLPENDHELLFHWCLMRHWSEICTGTGDMRISTEFSKFYTRYTNDLVFSSIRNKLELPTELIDLLRPVFLEFFKLEMDRYAKKLEDCGRPLPTDVDYLGWLKRRAQWS